MFFYRFCVVCAFVNNQHAHEGVEDLTSSLKTSISDTNTYLNNTSSQINTLFVVNYNEFEQTTFRILSGKCIFLFF